jgi:hypothetical protein
MDGEPRSFDLKQFLSDFFSGMTRRQVSILAGMAVFLLAVHVCRRVDRLRGFGGGLGLSAPEQSPTVPRP